MGAFKRLAGNFRAGTDHCRRLVKPQGSPAVINRRSPQIFQRIRPAYDTEIILVPVLVDNQIVQHKHPPDRFANAWHAKVLTAVQVMLV